jgi:hypothetical protein
MTPQTISYSDAQGLARSWVEATSRGTGALHERVALAKPYGWVFFWDGREYLETGNPRKRFAGNGPVIVNRVNGEVRATSAALPLDVSLAQYEGSLPPAWLTLDPEQPATNEDGG